MDYQKIHDNIITNAKARSDIQGYFEIHHILPRSFGGTDDKENLVKLTGREHFIIHRILAKLHPNSGMVHAVYKMACTGKDTKYKVTSRTYEFLREAHSKRASSDLVAAKKKSNSLQGRKQSKEHIEKRVKSRKTNGVWHKEETKKKISQANSGREGYWKGKSLPEDAIEKRKQTMLERGGWTWDNERREKRSEYVKSNPIKKPPLTAEQKQKLAKEKSRPVECTHCGKIGAFMVMRRWHFDNCKHKN